MIMWWENYLKQRCINALFVIFMGFLLFLQYTIYVLTVFVFVAFSMHHCAEVTEDLCLPFNNHMSEGLLDLNSPHTILLIEKGLPYVDLDESEYLIWDDDYDPFKEFLNKDLQHSNINLEIIDQNKLNFETNAQLNYDIFNIGKNRFIISNGHIFDSELFKTLSDISVNITETTVDNNRIINITIDSEVANAYFDSTQVYSSNSLFSGLSEARYAADMQYETEVRNIRTSPYSLFNSPELQEIIGGSFSIVEVSPTSSPEPYISVDNDLSALEWRNQMRVDWRERIEILFSNQNSEFEPLPSWFEVPTRPSDPLAIEQWERDNVMRSYWANRLNEGYIQTNIIVKDSPFEGFLDDYYSLDWFENGYQNLNYELEKSFDIFQEEDLGLHNLFENGYQDITYEPEKFLDIFEEDDLGLQNLFDSGESAVHLSIAFIPIIVYEDADKDKLKILNDNRNKSAVYRWVNKENGNYYIGSSINLTVRMYTYYSLLSLAKSNRPIDRALLKYGYSCFRFEILEYCTTENVIKREQFYLDNSNPTYNIVKTAGSTLGYKHKEETIEKIRNFIFSDEVKKRKALSTTNATNARKLSVTVKNVKTNEIFTYDSLTSAGKALGVSKSAISQSIINSTLIKKIYAITIIK